MRFADDTVRLVPRPLWGVSLAALCTAKTWDGLRQEAEGFADGRCRYAGEPGRHAPGPLHGHERWRYEGDRAVLEGLWSLCATCHDLFHPGRVLAAGGPAAYARLIDLYAIRCTVAPSEAERRYNAAFEAHAAASAVETWTIDVGTTERHWPLRPKRAAAAAIRRHRWIGDPFGRR